MTHTPTTHPPTRTVEAGETAPSAARRPRYLIARLTAASLAGAATAGASAPWEQRWLLPLAIAALVLLLQRVSVRYASLLGWMFGLGFVLVLTAWMRAVGTDAWLLIGAAMAAYCALACLGIVLVSRLAADL